MPNRIDNADNRTLLFTVHDRLPRFFMEKRYIKREVAQCRHEKYRRTMTKLWIITLTPSQFKLLKRTTFANWKPRDEGRPSTLLALLAKYSAFHIRSDGVLIGLTSDSLGRSSHHILDESFVDTAGFKALQFKFASVETDV